MSRPKKPISRRSMSGSSSRKASSSRPSSEPTARASESHSVAYPRAYSSSSRRDEGSALSDNERVGGTGRTGKYVTRSSSGTTSRYSASSASHRSGDSRPVAPSRSSGAGTRSGGRTAAGSHSSGVASNRSRSGAPSNAGRPPARRPMRKRKKMRPRWGRWLILALVVLLCVTLGPQLMQRFSNDEEVATQVQAVTKPLVSDDDKSGFDETINSDSAILINAGNGDVLYEKAADTQRAPASLVKMMTAYVAIKHCDDVNKEVQMPKEAYKGLEEGLASQSGIKVGETVTVRDLLYAAILSSGGDAANALALTTSGSIKDFVTLMNEEAKAMGLDSTVFKNPTGLDASGQVSTCRDMARLVKGALGNSLFKEVFTARTYTTTANEAHSEGLELSHTMSEDINTFQRYFDTSGYEIIGGKTGYTENAGNCLVTLADKKKAPEFIVVTMHATGTGDQYYQAFHDAVTLYGEAYEKQGTAPPAQDGSFD